MNAIEYNIKLNMKSTGVVASGIQLKQGDSQMELIFSIYNGGELVTDSNIPQVYFRRPNGTTVFGSTSPSTNNTYIYTVIGNELEIPGTVLCDVKFKAGEGGEGRESTCTFSIDVVPDTITANTGGAGIYDNDLAENIKLAQDAAEAAEHYADEARQFAPEGYEDLIAEVDELSSDYTELSTKVTESADWLKSKNLLDYNGLLRGQYDQNNNGEFISSSAMATPKYKVLPNSHYYLSGVNIVRYHYWNNDAYIGSEVIEGGGSVVVPSNANTIAFHGAYGAFATESQLEVGDVATEYVPYSMSNSEITKYRKTWSNPNLLDNAWFTVNQRGQSVYTGSVTGLDRWLAQDGSGSCEVRPNNGYVELIPKNSGCLLRQITPLKKSDYVGSTFTLSIMLKNGTVYSGSGIVTDASATTNFIDFEFESYSANLRYNPTYQNGQFYININVTDTPIQMKAVKLELGSVSTLANDVAPNYTEELLKCQGSTADSADTYANDGVLFNNGAFYYTRKNNVVTIHLMNSATLGSDGATLTQTLPVGYRPRLQTIVPIYVYNGSSYVSGKMVITSSGAIQIVSQFNIAIPNAQVTYCSNFIATYVI